jgi:hypothetical protein
MTPARNLHISACGSATFGTTTGYVVVIQQLLDEQLYGDKETRTSLPALDIIVISLRLSAVRRTRRSAWVQTGCSTQPAHDVLLVNGSI